MKKYSIPFRMLITPQIAEQMLNQNTINRKIDVRLIMKYAADMAANKWTQCVMPIAFYKDTRDIADGQHRLYAVMESKQSIVFIIVDDLEREDGLNIDSGKPRSLVDAVTISGAATELTSSVVAICRAVETGYPPTGNSSNAQKLAVVEQHREAAEWANSHTPHTKSISNSAVMSAIARAWYVVKDHERLDEFAKVIGKGFSRGDDDTAAIAMRNYLLTNSGMASSSAMWRDTFLKCQNAIAHFMRRERLLVIRPVREEAYSLRKYKAR